MGPLSTAAERVWRWARHVEVAQICLVLVLLLALLVILLFRQQSAQTEQIEDQARMVATQTRVAEARSDGIDRALCLRNDSLRGLAALLVEDNPASRELAERVLLFVDCESSVAYGQTLRQTPAEQRAFLGRLRSGLIPVLDSRGRVEWKRLEQIPFEPKPDLPHNARR